MHYVEPAAQYVDAVKNWTRGQSVEALCRELGVYPCQLQDFLDDADPDPGLVVRLGAMMDGPGPQHLGIRVAVADPAGHPA